MSTKTERISQLIEVRTKILDTASALTPQKQEEIFLGVWSAKDLLAHLAGWDFANIEAVKAILNGELPDFYSHHDRDWKTFNARLVTEYNRDDFGELLSLVRDSHRQLIKLLETIPAKEFDNDRGLRFKGYKVMIDRILQAEASDEQTHYAQIKAFADGENQVQ